MAIEETMVIFDYFREGVLDGTVDGDGDTIVCHAMKSGYIPSATTHQFYSDVDPAESVATATLAGKTATDGVLSASNLSITIPDGDVVVGFLFVDTTIDVGESGRLVCYIGKDSEGNTLSITGDGNAITLRFDAGTGRILSV